MDGTGGRHTGPGMALIGALTAAMRAIIKNLAVEIRRYASTSSLGLYFTRRFLVP